MFILNFLNSKFSFAFLDNSQRIRIETYLSINLNHGFSMAWVYFVTTVRAKTDPRKIKTHVKTITLIELKHYQELNLFHRMNYYFKD